MYDSSKSRFHGAETFIMWEFEECPIPAGLCYEIVDRNILRALKDMGYYGWVTLRAYGDHNTVPGKLSGCTLFYAPPETRRQKILVDLLGRAIKRDRSILLNVILILGDISRHTGLLSAIRVLVSEGNCNLILSQPQDVLGPPPDGLDTVCRWEILAAQGRMVSRATGVTTLPPVPIEELLPKPKPLVKPPASLVCLVPHLSSFESVENMYDSSKSRFHEAETFVIWEFEECPIPPGVREVEASENISRALKGMGYYGEVTFRGYGDLCSEHGKEGFGVFYTLFVSPEMRRQKILVDLLGLAIGRDRSILLNLMLILGDISRHTGLLSAIRVLVSEGNCNLILSQPQDVSGPLPDGLDTVCRWEILAAQGRMVSRATGVTTLPPVPIEELLPKPKPKPFSWLVSYFGRLA